jgi:hypothetical protein
VKSASRSLLFLVLVVAIGLIAVAVSPAMAATEVILDNGEAGTSYTGTWYVSGVPGPYGADSLYSVSYGGVYTYDLALSQSGSYEVYLWWTAFDGRQPAVPVTVTYAGGTDSFTVDQQQNGSQWNLVGTYNFTTSATIAITSLNGTYSTCADAVRLVRVGDAVNQAPSAAIVQVTPNPVSAGDVVTFTGSGTDIDGTVTAYRWSSDIDGPLSDQASFSSSTLTTGIHTITFDVQDDDGVWSSQDTATLYVGTSLSDDFND